MGWALSDDGGYLIIRNGINPATTLARLCAFVHVNLTYSIPGGSRGDAE